MASNSGQYSQCIIARTHNLYTTDAERLHLR